MAKTRIKDTKDLFRGLASGLKTASVRPNIYGYEAHDKQIDFHSSGARGRLFIGGNRSGKTVGGAAEAIWTCLGQHPYRVMPWAPPIRGRVVAVDFLNGVEKIVKPEIMRWCPLSQLKGGSWDAAYDKELRTLNFENGSFIEFMSYDQDLDKFAGTSRHFVWFDEEPPKDIWIENNLRLLDVGGHFWITMTPVEGMTWVFDDIFSKEGIDPNIHVTEVDTAMNPHLNAGEIELVMAGLTEDEIKARVHGKFVQIGGLIYKNFSDKNIIDPMIPPINDEWLHFCMMDAGINNPTCFLWGAVDREGRIVIYDEYYKSGSVVAIHAQEIHVRNQQHKIVPSYYVGDPSIRNTDPITGTSVQIEYVDNGIPIVLGVNDVSAGINKVTQLVGDSHLPAKLFVTRNCVNLIWEMKRYRWSTWATKRHNFEKNKKEEPHKKDDHAVDALRYGIASRPQTEDHSIPENSSSRGYPEAIDRYRGLIDPGTGRSKPKQFDDTLGEDW